jgi:hypothetical protein
MVNGTNHGVGAHKRPARGHRDGRGKRFASPPAEGGSRRKQQEANLRLQGNVFAAILTAGSDRAGAVDPSVAALSTGAGSDRAGAVDPSVAALSTGAGSDRAGAVDPSGAALSTGAGSDRAGAVDPSGAALSTGAAGRGDFGSLVAG